MIDLEYETPVLMQSFLDGRESEVRKNGERVTQGIGSGFESWWWSLLVVGCWLLVVVVVVVVQGAR